MNSETSNQTNFTQHAVIDEQNQGIVAAVFDYPQNWRAESQVYWNYQFTSLPAAFYARVSNTQNSAALEFLPMECFSWTEPEMGIYGRGQSVGGVVNLPPMHGIDALIHLIIPKYRGDRQNLRVVETNAEPVAVNPPPQIQSATGFNVNVKIEYTENGQTIFEEFCAKHVVSQFPPMNNGWSMTYYSAWNLSELCCFRVESSAFESIRETFSKIRASQQINPQWSQLINNVSQQLLQNSKQIGDQQIQNGWDMLRMNGERIRETNAHNQAYTDGQWDRIRNSYNTPPPSSNFGSNAKESSYSEHNAFIDSIREEQTIYNPENSANEKFSNHYDHVWKDEFGNTFGTNDPNYDPNRDSNRNWTIAQKKRIGE